MKLSDYKDIINGKIIKDGTFETLEYCTSSCERPFLTFLENEKYLDVISKFAVCIITTEKCKNALPQSIKGIVIAEEAKKEFTILHNELSSHESYAGRRFKTTIGENCKISPLACIADENVRIGNNVEIAPFVVVKENVSIGDNCIIHENCVIGGKSFNFTKTKDEQMIGMKDIGHVELCRNVEICSNCHIANGPLPTDVTKLEDNVKLDAFVHVGHGTKIGKRTLIPAGAQIAGNVVVGQDAWIGVNATVANRVTIGDCGRVSLGAVVTKDVDEKQTVTGNFAIEHSVFIDNLKKMRPGGAKQK